MRRGKGKLLSVIVPVFRQEKTIVQDIRNLLNVLDRMPVQSEVIVVIDGEVDKSRQRALSVRDKRVSVVGYKVNKGKGYAVRYGMAKSKGSVVGFLDAGCDLNPEGLLLMYDYMRWKNADIVVGSKRHELSKVHYPAIRRIFSWVYQMIVRILFHVNVRDTQVGMKLYKREVLEDVLPRLLVKEFAFDIEILSVAYRLGYRRILEAPIELNFEGVTSSITSRNYWRVIFRVLNDTLAVFYRLRLLKYYDNASKRKWRYDPELNFRFNIG